MSSVYDMIAKTSVILKRKAGKRNEVVKHPPHIQHLVKDLTGANNTELTVKVMESFITKYDQ